MEVHKGSPPGSNTEPWAAGANDVAFGPGAARHADALAQRAREAQDPAAAGARAAAAASPAVPLPASPSMLPRWTSWEGREAAWHSYMLRAGLYFDDFSGAHTLNQNGNYLFISGENAAARDPLAHVLWLAWAGETPAASQDFAAYWAKGGGLPPAWIDLNTNAVASYPAPPGMVAVARIATASRVVDVKALPHNGFPPLRASPDYYSAALILLSRLAWQESCVA
jgi:hypothetical protein